MPNSNGYELARQLRNEPGLDAVILAALTGYGQDSDRQKAKEAGFDFHLVKPVSVEALEDLLSAPARTHNRNPVDTPGSANAIQSGLYR
jgi:CheY-like chemotaxis protein